MLKKLIERIFKREVITYLIAGVATTIVNFIVSYLLHDIMQVEENLTTVFAWVVAVAFAYLINAYWVFEHHYEGIRDELVKIGKFVAARIFTLIIEEGSIFVFCTKMGIGFWLVKIPAAVIVIVLNFVFSKLMIFVKKK